MDVAAVLAEPSLLDLRRLKASLDHLDADLPR
jgi:hypothetical protein